MEIRRLRSANKMKTFFLVAFAACFLLAVSEAKKCKTADDCDTKECCVKFIFTTVCRDKKEKGDYCAIGAEDFKDEDGRYRFSCPCAEGLECKSQKDKDDGGILNVFIDKCE